MMRLPFNTNTFANTYQPEAFVSGIVFGENQKHLPYFLSNYIRPVYYKNGATALNYYIDNPFLLNHGLIKRDYTIVPKTCLQAVNWSNVARNALDNNKYVFGSFNDEFIPQKSSYNKQYFWHDYILYGYDDCGFISAAYLADGHYHEFKIAFDDFNCAVKTLREHQFMHFLEYDNSISLDFMLDLVINAFRDYITSKELNNDGTTYGLNAFRLFANEVKNTKEEIDLRSICFLREHKLLMKMRLEYMMNNNYIQPDSAVIYKYNDVYIQLHKAVLLSIKYNITKNTNLLSHIYDIITRSLVQDQKILADILSNILI